MRKGRRWLCPCLAEWTGGIPAWLALLGLLTLGPPLQPCGSHCIPALALGGTWVLWVLLWGGEGSPAPVLLSQLSAAPLVLGGFRWFMSRLGAVEG